MVLMIILCLFSLLTIQDKPLLEQYNKEVYKTIKKTYEENHFELLMEEQGCYLVQAETTSLGYILLAEVAACHLGGCTAPSAEKSATTTTAPVSAEYFDVLVILDHDKTILKVKILNYFSDYGYEVTSKKYLNKYKGKNVCDFVAGSQEVDAISGATISSLALEGFIGQYCLRP